MRTLHYFWWILLLLPITAQAQKIKHFEYSECLGSNSAHLIEEIKTDKTYEATFTAFNNCIGKFEPQIELLDNNSKLNVIIWIEDSRSDGEIEVALCDCIFKFQLKVKGINGNQIDSLLIYGGSFEKHNEQYDYSSVFIDELVITDEEIMTSDSVYTIVDEPVKFMFSLDSIGKYISRRIESSMPELNVVNDKYYVEFIVAKDGSIISNRLLKGVEAELDSVFMTALDEMNISFIPAKDRGSNVKQKIVIPINVKTPTPKSWDYVFGWNPKNPSAFIKKNRKDFFNKSEYKSIVNFESLSFSVLVDISARKIVKATFIEGYPKSLKMNDSLKVLLEKLIENKISTSEVTDLNGIPNPYEYMEYIITLLFDEKDRKRAKRW